MAMNARLSGLVCVAAAAAPAIGQMSYVSQLRRVSVAFENLIGQTFEETITAPDFAPFNAVADLGGPIGSDFFLYSSQSSRLLSDRITLDGTIGIRTVGGQVFGSTADATLDVRFSISAAQTAYLDFQHLAAPALTSSVLLTGPGTNLSISNSSFQWTSVLQPGEYRFRVLAGGPGSDANLHDLKALLIVPSAGVTSIALLVPLTLRRHRGARA